jgi:hypothetical protein
MWIEDNRKSRREKQGQAKARAGKSEGRQSEGRKRKGARTVTEGQRRYSKDCLREIIHVAALGRVLVIVLAVVVAVVVKIFVSAAASLESWGGIRFVLKQDTSRFVFFIYVRVWKEWECYKEGHTGKGEVLEQRKEREYENVRAGNREHGEKKGTTPQTKTTPKTTLWKTTKDVQ